MSLRFESVRFGEIEVPEEDAIEFPLGLIGLGGLRYALVDRNPGTGFLWLHAVDDPALALPVVDPAQFFSDFSLLLSPDDQETIGIEDPATARILVTVRAAPNPLDITANLRAPLVIHEGRGYQVINGDEQAPLQAPLFTIELPQAAGQTRSADAA